jgi:hypothetical protein
MLGEKRAMLLLATLSLGGCAAASWFGVPPSGGADTLVEAASAQSTQNGVGPHALALYLDTMQDLLEGDPVRQAEVYREALYAAESWPTTTNLLRFALTVATPGHPWSNPLDAREQLTALLGSDQTLLPEERTLATVQLKAVEQRISLDEETRRLQSEAQEALARQNSDSAQLLRAALEENERLREELADAQEKLEAITNIERSIRERESATDSP